MSDSDNINLIVELWMEKGNHDLVNAKHTLTMTETCPFDTVCFHAQQCVEKYLKALLTYCAVEFNRTHDLTELLPLVPKSLDLSISFNDLSLLNAYSVDIRYPGIEEPLTRDEAEEATAIADGISKLIRSKIK